MLYCNKKLPKLREIPTLFCFARSAEKIFFEVLTISCAGGRQTHGILDFGRRVEQRWAYYFLRRRPPDTRDHGLRPARRAEVALLFLVQEAARHTGSWTSAGALREVGLLFSFARGHQPHADAERRGEERRRDKTKI